MDGGHPPPMAMHYNAQPVAGPAYVVQQPAVAAGGWVFKPSGSLGQYSSMFKGLGIGQVVVGHLCLGLAITSLVMHPFGNSATGVWGGIWFIISGSLAMVTAARPHSCNVIAGLVISIIASLMAFSGLIVEAVAAGSSYYYTSWPSLGYLNYGISRGGINSSVLYAGLHGAVAFFCFAEFVLAIIHSALCCKTGCGRQLQGDGQLAAVATTQMPNQAVVSQTPQYAMQNQGYNGQKI